MSAVPRLSPVPDDDATLVARAAQDDERAFVQLYRRHARYVARVAFRLLGDEVDLDDVVQETFVDASHALGSVRDGTSVRAWLATIAARKVARVIARRRRSRFLASLFGTTRPAASAPVVEGEAYALYQALDRLSAERRIPWALREIEGMTLPEVAATCGVSLATAKRRIAEASELLRKRGLSIDGAGASADREEDR